MPTSWNTVIFKFRLIFAIDERRIVSGQDFHKVVWWSPLIPGNKRNTDQWASTKHRIEGFSLHNFPLVGRKNQANFENDCISRNRHRIKITQPNLMILVSFSSGEDALSNDVKIYHTFSSQSTENPPFPFFGTPGISSLYGSLLNLLHFQMCDSHCSNMQKNREISLWK